MHIKGMSNSMPDVLQNFNCPICGKRDHVLLVDTIVQGGSERVRSRHVCRNQARPEIIHDQSVLAKKLHPPKDHLRAVCIGTILILSALLLSLFITIERHPRLLAFDLYEIIRYITALDILAMLFLIPLSVLLCIHLAYTIIRRPRLFEKIQRWHALYYCSSDDIVFMPGKIKKHAPPSKMRQLL
jgi:hypothetical protein